MNDKIEMVEVFYTRTYTNDDDYTTYHNYEFKTKDLALHFIKIFAQIEELNLKGENDFFVGENEYVKYEFSINYEIPLFESKKEIEDFLYCVQEMNYRYEFDISDEEDVFL